MRIRKRDEEIRGNADINILRKEKKAGICHRGKRIRWLLQVSTKERKRGKGIPWDLFACVSA